MQSLYENVKTIFWALLIAFVFRTLILQPFWIPSGSMKDTLLVGDFLFVNKFAYGYSRYSCPFSACPFSGRIFASTPKRGDVVVFRHPIQKVDFIKRLIGLPGDRVQVRNGQVWINETPIHVMADGFFDEPYAPQGPLQDYPSCAKRIPDATTGGIICRKEKFQATLPSGRTHSILNIRTTALDSTPTFKVPEGHYFFMGDNRDNSLDSRLSAHRGGVGFLPTEYLIGRAEWVLFSSAGPSLFYVWKWRADRFFKAIR